MNAGPYYIVDCWRRIPTSFSLYYSMEKCALNENQLFQSGAI